MGEEDTASEGSGEDDERCVPFPAEHHAQKKALAEARRSRDRALEAGATFAMAELLLRSGKYLRASKLASAAEGLFTKANDRAKALRLHVKAVVREPERELFEDVLSSPLPPVAAEAQAKATREQLAQRLEGWQASGYLKAAALTGLALADVHLLLGQLREALAAAEGAHGGYERAGDLDGAARALQMTATIRLKLGTDLDTQGAVDDAEKALVQHQKRGKAERESATLRLLAKIHTRRREFQDAYTFALGAVKLAQANGHMREEALAMKDLALVLLLSKGDTDRAAQFALDAAEIFHNLDDWLSEIAARHVLASAYQADGFVNMAHEAMLTALKLARQLGDLRQIGAALDGVTRILIKAEAPEAALECLQEEVKEASGAKGLRREFAALERVAAVQLSLQKREDAVDTAERVVDLARAGGPQDLAKAYRLMARVSFAAQHAEEALDASAMARKLMKELGDVEGLVDIWRLELNFYKETGKEDRIELAYKGMQAVCEDFGQKSSAADILLEKAECVLHSRGLLHALELFRTACRMFENIPDRQGQARALLRPLAFPDFIQKRPDEALRNAKEARQLCLKIGDVEGEIRALTALADIHLWKRNAADTAVEASLDALELARTAGSKRCQALALQVVARTHAELIFRDESHRIQPPKRVVQDAISVALEASALFSALGDGNEQAATLILLSRLHGVKGEGEASLQSAVDALDCAERVGDLRRQGRALLAMAKTYLKAGQARDVKQAAEQARRCFEAARDEQGSCECRRIVRAARGNRKRSGARKQVEFEASWGQLHGKAEEASAARSSAVSLVSFPESLELDLKWYVWNTIWYAANLKYAESCEANMRRDSLDFASDDLRRMEKHKLALQTSGALDSSSLDHLAEQAQVAGHAVADAVRDGMALTHRSVRALPVPAHVETVLWSGVVHAVRLAAQSVAARLSVRGKSSSSDSDEEEEEEECEAAGPSGIILGLSAAPRAVARPIASVTALSGTVGHGNAGDVQNSELDVAQRHTDASVRLEEANEEPGSVMASRPAAVSNSNVAAAQMTPSSAEEGKLSAPAANGTNTLVVVLQAVKRDWTAKQLETVQGKLAKIHITSAEELFEALRLKGVKGVNATLTASGQKCLKSETLADLHEYSESAGRFGGVVG